MTGNRKIEPYSRKNVSSDLDHFLGIQGRISFGADPKQYGPSFYIRYFDHKFPGFALTASKDLFATEYLDSPSYIRPIDITTDSQKPAIRNLIGYYPFLFLCTSTRSCRCHHHYGDDKQWHSHLFYCHLSTFCFLLLCFT